MARRSTSPAKPITPAGNTVKVQSTIHIGGLKPGQIAEVDDTEFVRGLIRQGLWLLLVESEVLTGTDELAETFGDDLAEAQTEEG